ncbi:two-component system sensor histidine kinase NtrB [Desulfoplanes formicivorans]|uniref:histidine kinase n=1 Tax=Desulfoplanes formicivorans TaxID=1592317 RepID=A0A194AI01_9BACT|nr:PAS domain-containing hybrid sensor histidine kinase/response regulator [Desulfoplanes formicivorans]GAU09707.1 hypothetical protein DPF_2438 [Desulfoplanes formicivorans]
MRHTSDHLEEGVDVGEQTLPTACSSVSRAGHGDLLRFSKILDLSHDLLILAECSNGRIVDGNRTACTRLGYEYDQLTRLHLDRILSSRVMERVRGMLTLQGAEFAEITGELITSFGEGIPGEIVLQRMLREDACYLAVVIRDSGRLMRVQEDKLRLEQQLLEARRMETIITFAGGLAHDFNNLLQIVSGNIQILGLKNRDANLKRHIQAIEQATLTASQLVQRLRTISRKGERSKHLVHLNDVIREVLRLRKQHIPEKVVVDLQLDSSLPGILADGVHMEQLFFNLLQNALDALDGQGRIHVATCLQELSSEDAHAYGDLKPGPYVRFSFADTGQGMVEEVRTRIFEPFFTTKKAGEGTGLGLSTVYAIVRDHEGHVTCRSVPGQGTTFRFLFPAVPEAAVPQEHRGMDSQA